VFQITGVSSLGKPRLHVDGAAIFLPRVHRFADTNPVSPISAIGPWTRSMEPMRCQGSEVRYRNESDESSEASPEGMEVSGETRCNHAVSGALATGRACRLRKTFIIDMRKGK
jgi:heat shock protein HslJ